LKTPKARDVSITERDLKGIEVAKGVRYYTVDLYAFQLGVPVTSFCRFIRTLNVPIVRMFGRRYVQHQAFVVAMAAIGMVGQPDYWGPSKSGKHKEKVDKMGGVRKLELRELEKRIDLVIAHILYGARISGLSTDANSMDMIRENLRELRLRVANGQSAYEKLAVKQALRDEILNPIPEAIMAGLAKFVRDNAPSHEESSEEGSEPAVTG